MDSKVYKETNKFNCKKKRKASSIMDELGTVLETLEFHF